MFQVIFVCVFFLVTSELVFSQDVINNEFFGQNCETYYRHKINCRIYKWRYPDAPVCVPWDTKLCEYYIRSQSCVSYDCSVRFLIIGKK